MHEIQEITGMRGFASLGVVVFDLFTISALLRASGVPAFVLSWNSGVDFFFVFSGFLLSLPFMGSEKVSLRAFYTKRIFRILPVYYLSIGVLGTALILANRATILQVLVSLVFGQSLSPSTFNSINGVNWTLVIEEIFYATLPLFAILFTKSRWKFALPACIALSLIYRYMINQQYSSGDLAFYLWQYPSFVGHYAIGLTLANLYGRGRMNFRFGSSLPALFSVGILLLTQFEVGQVYSIGNNLVALPGLIFAFEYGALIFFTLTSPLTSWARRLFTNGPALFAGKISYSTYTWHLPIEVSLFQMGFPITIWAPVSVGLAVLTATLSYRNLEAPVLQMRNRFLGSRNWAKMTQLRQSIPL
jgi:peptidoglycan/LPS O-acetylase OafA/YrhL